MLLLWRIVSRKFLAPQAQGIGARLMGGRWNSKGRAVIYAAGSQEEALAEIIARTLHASVLKHQGYVLLPLYVPGHVSVRTVDEKSVLQGWPVTPSTRTREVGDAWLQSEASCLLRVPSAKIRGRDSYLINPEHTAYSSLVWLPPEEIDNGLQDQVQISEGIYEDVLPTDLQTHSLIRQVFVCHAKEDRNTIVKPLIDAFEKLGISYWYDEDEIKWGDSITQKVNEGLVRSRYLIAVVSEHFVKRPWQRREMNAALSVEASSGRVKVLLLLVGTAEQRTKLMAQLALQNDKLYLVWNGDPEPTVSALIDRLSSD